MSTVTVSRDPIDATVVAGGRSGSRDSTVVVDGALGDDPARHVLQEQILVLRCALASQPVIEQAKGAVMLRFRIDAETAFAVLTRLSQDSNIKVRDIAATLCGVIGGEHTATDLDPRLGRVVRLLLSEHPRPDGRHCHDG